MQPAKELEYRKGINYTDQNSDIHKVQVRVWKKKELILLER